MRIIVSRCPFYTQQKRDSCFMKLLHVLSVNIKRGYFRFFFKIDLCSATSMESSRCDRSNDMAENWSSISLKNIKLRTTPFYFHSQTGRSSLKQVFRFYCAVSCVNFFQHFFLLLAM